MTGLFIYTSNRMEILAEQLAQIVRTPLPSPLTPETIVVQSRGMERWISMELAARNGISANCSFPFPNAFLETIFKRIRPDFPEISLFDPEIMAFRLVRIIPQYLNHQGFENLKSYLTDDDNQLKLFQLAGKIADLFDQYLVFRPELIFQWEQKKEEKHPVHLWQARLWRELVAETEDWHRAQLRQELFVRIDRRRLDPAELPARVSIFGISYLPLFHLQSLAQLSRLIDVNLFLIDPCREYWADIVSEQELKKIRRKHPRIAENMEWYHFEKGNRLLASMGTQGRNFFDSVTGFDGEVHEKFVEPETGSLLARLQSDVLNLREFDESDAYGYDKSADPPREPGAEGFCSSGKDASLQVHSCHSPMREIEVLHDNLLAMFEEDSALLPKDIIVMTPDIDTYAPYVHAVFDAQTDETLRIPYSIADQSYLRENRMIEGFLALLEMADSRCGAVQVIRLLEFSGIKKRFGLAESDLTIIERWIKDTHIRWGIDQTSRLEAGLPGFAENTWRAGLERLLLGYAMPGDSRTMFNGILPFDHIEGGEAQILGRFLEFVEKLFAWTKILKKPRKLPEWQQTLLALIDQFFRPDENTEREFQLLRRAADELGGTARYANFHEDIEPRVIRYYLKSHLEQNNFGSGFLTGGITFCAMLPMRSIPFEIICLIGMNNTAFPRDNRPLSFDLMAQAPRTGDRSRRNDDKYLFLESVISARKKLYISYVGQSIQDNSPIPPSTLVSELLDTIAERFNSADNDILEQIVTHHRLQQFSTGYYKADGGLFSYSTENLLACTGALEKRAELPFFNTKLPMGDAEAATWHELDLDALCLFFSNPAMFLIQQRLGIKLEDKVHLLDERENFVLQPLERYLVGQNLVDDLVSGATLQDFKAMQKAIGQLPHGNVGDYYYAEMVIEAQQFIGLIETFSAAESRDSITIDLNAEGFHLHGRLVSLSELGYIHIRYAKRRVKDLLKVWIHHLVYCHSAPSGYARSSYLICKDSAVRFEPVCDSLSILKDLLKLFWRGLEKPLHFFPISSFEYADRLLRKSATEPSARVSAQKKWMGSDFEKFARGESKDPYYDLCFRLLDPIDEDFQKTAIQIFKPLLTHCKEIRL